MNRRGKKYPVKTTVNLVYRPKRNISLMGALLSVALFAVVLVVFAKFAVIDRLTASGQALARAEELERQLAGLQESNSDYDEVLREYQHYYFSAAGSEGENNVGGAYVDCQDVMGLVDTELLHKAGIQMVNLTGNVLTVNLTKINLERASVIAKNLGENKMVREVTVSTASKHQETEGTMVFLNIILNTEQDAAQGPETEGDA